MKLSSLFKKNRVNEKYPWVLIDYSQPHWEIENPENGRIFFLEIQKLVPQHSVMYLEGGFWRGELRSFIEKNNIQEKPKIPRGTLWPKPQFCHIPIKDDSLSEFLNLTKSLVYPEIATHIHIYVNNYLLIQWHDAFISPIIASIEIPEDKIRKFCDRMNTKYEKKSE